MYLQHYGVKGMKWGVRRYQDKSGTLTEEGRNRMFKDLEKEIVKTGKVKNGLFVDPVMRQGRKELAKQYIKEAKAISRKYPGIKTDNSKLQFLELVKGEYLTDYQRIDDGSLNGKLVRTTIDYNNLSSQTRKSIDAYSIKNFGRSYLSIAKDEKAIRKRCEDYQVDMSDLGHKIADSYDSLLVSSISRTTSFDEESIKMYFDTVGSNTKYSQPLWNEQNHWTRWQ